MVVLAAMARMAEVAAVAAVVGLLRLADKDVRFGDAFEYQSGISINIPGTLPTP